MFVFPRHSQGQKGMEDDDMQSVHGPEAAQIVEQHPAQVFSNTCTHNHREKPKKPRRKKN